ncbi:MAG: DUF3617 domain-containing protein [Gammaproteobacteria bacterium]|nr:DUF3617 domain-containing protein [Gammaproteobacteria bacterium]
MKTKFIFLLFSAGLLALPLAVHADELSQKLADLIQPGQWESTVHIQMSVVGTNMTLPAQTTTTKRCVKQDDFDDLAAPDMKNMKCNITQKELSGNTLHLGLTCTGKKGTFTLNGTTTFASRTSSTSHYVMTGEMRGMQMKFVSDSQSKRIGDCTKSSGH